MDREKEISEARYAAQQALSYLRAAQQDLKSAGNWGLVDILGGGMLMTFMKRSKMNRAQQNLEQARYALHRLQKEMRDVDRIADIRIDVGDFLSFADYFFDGVVADWLVQSKISDARRQVDDAIRKVEGILNQLSRL
ncbi:MAG: hypothetical protein LUE29_02800 [Lachnospiraceae bacterium]|nr:hypothetical protein [Lachnospiraceae bacterium]